MIITISGNAGSGKSTVAKELVKSLGAERIYVGGIRRELARAKGLTLKELNQYALNHPETDVNVDLKAAEEARILDRQGKIVIVEGRTQYHFLPDSVKIYIKVNPDEGARRIWGDMQTADINKERNEANYRSLEEVKTGILARDKADVQRYKKYYGLDHRIESQYDLVIDSTLITADEVVQKIKKYLKSKKLIRCVKC